MRRKSPPKSAANVALFPFLAVLLCTMGALILLLVVIARQAQQQAAALAAGSNDQQKAAQETLEDLEWMASRLVESRNKTTSQLAEERMKLSHVEDHARRLREQLAELASAADKLQQTDRLDHQGRELKRAEIATLNKKVAKAKSDLENALAANKGTTEAYAIIPFAGKNGTRRRPIYIECRADAVILQPEGVVLSEGDLALPGNVGNPLAAGLRAAREYLSRKQRLDPNSGEPYPLLLVRPTGVGAYWVAREAMLTWGDEFGYELVDQDWKLDFPEPDIGLQNVLKMAVNEARRKQEQLVQQAPRLYRADNTPSFQSTAGSSGKGSAGRNGGGRSDDRPGLASHGRRGSGLGDSEGGYGAGGIGNKGSKDDSGNGRYVVNPYAAITNAAGHGAGGANGAGAGSLPGNGMGPGNGTGPSSSSGDRYGPPGQYAMGGSYGTGNPYSLTSTSAGYSSNGGASGGLGNGQGPGNYGSPGGANGTPGGNGFGNGSAFGGPGGTGGGMAGGPGSGSGMPGGSGLGQGGAPSLAAAGNAPYGSGGTGDFGGGGSPGNGGPGSGGPGNGGSANGSSGGGGAGGSSGGGGGAGGGGGGGGKPGSMGQPPAGGGNAPSLGAAGANNQPLNLSFGGSQEPAGQQAGAAGANGANQSNGAFASAGTTGANSTDRYQTNPNATGATGAVPDSQGMQPGLYRPGATGGSGLASRTANGSTTPSSQANNSQMRRGGSQGGTESSGAKAPSGASSGNQANDDDSSTKQRRKNWGLRGATHAVAVSRPILLECHGDHLTIVPDRPGSRKGKIVPLEGRTSQAVDELVSGIWDQIDSWGIAGNNMYWKPTLAVQVFPGGEQRYADLQKLLADSGFDLKQRAAPIAPPRLPAAAPLVQPHNPTSLPLAYPRTNTPN